MVTFASREIRGGGLIKFLSLSSSSPLVKAARIFFCTNFDTARQVVEALENEVAQHRNGAEPNDNLTMLCLRVQ